MQSLKPVTAYFLRKLLLFLAFSEQSEPSSLILVTVRVYSAACLIMNKGSAIKQKHVQPNSGLMPQQRVRRWGGTKSPPAQSLLRNAINRASRMQTGETREAQM